MNLWIYKNALMSDLITTAKSDQACGELNLTFIFNKAQEDVSRPPPVCAADQCSWSSQSQTHPSTIPASPHHICLCVKYVCIKPRLWLFMTGNTDLIRSIWVCVCMAISTAFNKYMLYDYRTIHPIVLKLLWGQYLCTGFYVTVLGRSAVSRFRVERQHMNSTTVQGKQEVVTDGAELWLHRRNKSKSKPRALYTGEAFAVTRQICFKGFNSHTCPMCHRRDTKRLYRGVAQTALGNSTSISPWGFRQDILLAAFPLVSYLNTFLSAYLNLFCMHAIPRVL